MVKSFIGYGLIAFAGSIMRNVGLTLGQWETWAIMLGFIIGCFMVNKQ